MNIVRLYASLEDENFIYLILEYVKQGNLFFIIRNKGQLNEAEAFYFFIQVTAGIYFLHKNGFIHRDIKPRNVILNRATEKLRLIDFGLSEVYSPNTLLSSNVASRNFKSPELLCGYGY